MKWIKGGDTMYRLIRVIEDNKNFLVVEAQNTFTGEKTVTYINRDLDLEKDLFSQEDLMIL